MEEKQKTGPVEDVLNNLNDTVKQLDVLVNKLRGQLKPVLESEGEEDKEELKQPSVPVTCPLERALMNTQESVNNIKFNIDEILRRLRV